MKNILIIGGGASGMMAALSCKTSETNVTIYEKNDRIGKKILATGNGKCNLTNAAFDVSYYHTRQKKMLESYFQRFAVHDTIRFFENLGLMLREKDGYFYPYSEQAAMVLDVLRNALEEQKINIKTEISGIKIKEKSGRFLVTSNLGNETFDVIILACGSKAGIKNADDTGYQYACDFGHTLIPLVPALVQVHCIEKIFKGIAGVRAKVGLKLLINSRLWMEEQGELQLTDYGVSGIPVFQISREIAYALKSNKKVSLYIDFVPHMDVMEWKRMVVERVERQMGHTVLHCATGTLNKKLISMFIKQHGLKEDEIISKANKDKIVQMFVNMKEFIVTPTKVNPFENAQVCAGGIDLSELDDNLQSRLQKNIYMCGEMLDVDGKCGGYNLQWAWTSGYIAGKGALHS